MFLAALVIIAPEWKQPKCYQLINGKTKCGISILYKSARAATLGGLSNRNVFSHSSGSWKSLIKVWQFCFLLSSHALSFPGMLSPCVLTGPFLCSCASSAPLFLIRIPVLLDQGPALMTSFNLNSSLKAQCPNKFL